MELGFIDSNSIIAPLEWYPAKREYDSIFVSNKRNIKLATPTSASVRAYRCAVCSKIIIDEAELAK